MTKLYRCKGCGYVQDFSPNDREKMVRVFPEVKNKDKKGKLSLPINAGQCPSCKKNKAF